LEALCFLSAGVSQLHDGVHQYTQPSNTASRRQQQSNQQPAGKHAKQQAPRRQQQPLKKHHVRYSPASETSSGATQCALTRLQAAELVHEIHPAALASCELGAMQQHEQQQAGKQGTESSDTRQAPDALSPMPSDDYAAQSRQCSPDVQAAASSPGSPQQEQRQEHHNQRQAGTSLQQQQQQPQVLPEAASPADQGDAVQAEHAAAMNQSALQVPIAGLLPSQPPSTQPLIVKPPVKGCFWHVYIARKIQADRQRQEQEQQQQQVQPRKSNFKRPQQQEEQDQLQQCNRQVALASAATTAAAAAALAELPAKRRRMGQQAGRNTAAGATAADVMLASVVQQQAAPLQQAVLQALLQQQGHAAGAPAQLQQPAPTPMQLLQAVCSATGLSVPPAAVHAPALPLSTMQLLPSLPAAATSSNQLCGGPNLSAPAARTALASQGGVFAASTAVGSVAATGSNVVPWLPAEGQFGAAGLLGPGTVPHTLPRQAAAAGQQLSLLGAPAAASSGSSLLGQMMAGTWPGAAVGWQGAAPLGMLLGAAGLASRAAAGRIAV